MTTAVEKLDQILTQHEGKRELPYDDATGDEITSQNVTIGVGCNLSIGLTDDEIAYLLANRREKAANELHDVLGDYAFQGLSDVRWAAFTDMVYNLGQGGFSNFTTMIDAIERQDWDAASVAMLDSKWAEQVGQRAITLSDMVRTDRWPEWVTK